MVGWDKNARKATTVASRDRLMVVSYYDFTIFFASMALTVHVISIVAIAPIATISLLLLFSNPPS
jgi:hypothetical protein